MTHQNQFESIAGELLDNPHTKKMFTALRTKYILRTVTLYLLPLILLVAFFYYEYDKLMQKSREVNLISVAETKSRLMDIYLLERINNIFNTIENTEISNLKDSLELNKLLHNLKKHSAAFTDIGFFDTSSIQVQYAGPLQELKNKDYRNEEWYRELINSEKTYVATDIYSGFRKIPHFTIGTKKIEKGKTYLFRISLDPKIIYGYMTANMKNNNVDVLVVNSKGQYQLSSKAKDEMMKDSPYRPSRDNIIGISSEDNFVTDKLYAYSWLSGVNWAVISIEKEESEQSFFNLQMILILSSLTTILLLFLIILFRSKNIIKTEKERILIRLQLEHASKLATVGELAAGIAHEIGNPLNIIANEVGIMEDFANPKFKINKTINDLEPHFKKITNSVYRIKDINKKLLTFVRQDEYHLIEANVNEIIEDFLSGFLERELMLDNIEIKKDLNKNIPMIMCDNNQLRQVIINIINNAKDAINTTGEIKIKTYNDNQNVFIEISDNGTGIDESKIDKVFLPFFTTKPVGKGTGLGLSVSYNIIKSMGGTIHVKSKINEGTVFTISLPIEHS